MKRLHLISFDVPWPADYGGVIDVFYKLKALKQKGVSVILHTFLYHREKAEILEEYCEKVYYYKRDTGLLRTISSLPYIVKSRMDSELLRNLSQDNDPVIFEGLHTCGFIGNKKLQGKLKVYRESNIEHQYYRGLAAATSSPGKKLFFYSEALKLKRFQQKLKYADLILPVSTTDESYLKNRFPDKEVVYLPSFHGMNGPDIPSGKGDYCLFQGNLSVPENEEAALWLVRKVFAHVPFRCIVAGRKPTGKLKKEIAKHPMVELMADPEDDQMEDLIRNAQVNVLVTLRPAGLKLKLVNALYKGRFCIANHHMLKGTGLDATCIRANTSAEIRKAITDVRYQSWGQEDMTLRKETLRPFNDSDKTENLLELLGFKSHMRGI